MTARPDIRDFTPCELEEIIKTLDEPGYRAEQIFRRLYRQRAEDFREISNTPASLRKKLAETFSADAPVLLKKFESSDGAVKFLFGLSDGKKTETVFIPSEKRSTICLSSQVGCSRGCSFCASGERGLERNLRPSEMTGQLISAEKITRRKTTNVVFMGMGEPFDNYENLCRTLIILNHPWGMNISARKITVSTAGVAAGIHKFASFELPVNLAVSLHAADDLKRNSIIPLNRKYPLEQLLKALSIFRKTGRKLTLEYALIQDFNDSKEDACSLARIANRLACGVNIIRLNPVPGKSFCPPSETRVLKFMDILHDKNVMVSLRRSKGADISAACGQLAGRANH